MTQAEYATTKVPPAVWVARPVPIEASDVDALPVRLSSGKAFLKVVAYPWGVEFDVCDTEGER